MIERESGGTVRARDSQNKSRGGLRFHDKLCCVWGILWHFFCRYVTCSLLCSRCPSPSMLSINWYGKREKDYEKDGVKNQLAYLLMRSWVSAESMSKWDQEDTSAQIPETLPSGLRKVDMCLLKYPFKWITMLYWPFKTSCLNTHIISNHSSRAALCERSSPTVARVKKRKGKNQSILARSHKEAEDYNTRWRAKDVFAFTALQRNLNSRAFSAVERPKLNNREGPLKVYFNLANFSR